VRPSVARARDASLGLWQRITEHGVNDMAAALAYRFFLALFPFAIFVAALIAFVAALFQVGDVTEPLFEDMDNELAELLAPLREELRAIAERQRPSFLSLGVIGSVWAASAGVGAIIRATNRAYQVAETRPYWKRCALSLGLTLIAGAALAGAFLLQVAGAALADVLARAGGGAAGYGPVLGAARWPLAVALLFLAAAILYWAAPDVDLPWRWVTPGAVVFVGGWLLATFGFSVYVTAFGDYGTTYGALAGVAVLLIWFYLTAYIVLCGAELNAFLDRSVAARGADRRSGVRRREGGIPREGHE
jgi:membrane protein